MKLFYPWIFRTFFAASLISITYLALAELPAMPVTLWDKANHAMAFLVLSFLADYSFPQKKTGYLHPAKWLGLFAYGCLIEIIQSFLPYRDASGLDLIANSVGLACYALGIFILQRNSSP